MRPIFLFLIMVLGLILQATVFVQKPFIWIEPVLTVLFVIFIAYYRGPLLAMSLGVLVGLLEDIVYGSLMGTYAFSLGVVGYFAGAIFRVFLHRSFIMLMFMILGFTAVYELITYGIATLFGHVHVDLLTMATHTIRLMIFNGVFALIFYPFADKWLPVEEEWGLGEEYR